MKEEIPPVEIADPSVQVEQLRGAAGADELLARAGGDAELPGVEVVTEPVAEPAVGVPEAEAVPAVFRAKAVDKVCDLAATLEEMCRAGPAESTGTRHFAQPLAGRFAGWEAVAEVRVTLQRRG